MESEDRDVKKMERREVILSQSREMIMNVYEERTWQWEGNQRQSDIKT
jgi:hypothetical protein